MQSTFVTSGTLTDDRTVTLDEALPLTSVRVRVTVEPLPTGEGRTPFAQLIREIRKRQQARGFRPSSKEDVDSALRSGRAGPECDSPIIYSSTFRVAKAIGCCSASPTILRLKRP